MAGLSSGGDARCLLIPAPDLPAELWELLAARRPVALVTELDGDEVVGTTLAIPETADTIVGAGRRSRRASAAAPAPPSSPTVASSRSSGPYRSS